MKINFRTILVAYLCWERNKLLGREKLHFEKVIEITQIRHGNYWQERMSMKEKRMVVENCLLD